MVTDPSTILKQTVQSTFTTVTVESVLVDPQSGSRKVKRLDSTTRDNKVRRTTHSDELASEESHQRLDSIEGYLSDTGSIFSMTSSCISLASLSCDEADVEICESLSPNGDYIIKQRDRHELLLFLEAIKNRLKG